jgi:hypothetical protein
MTADNAKQKHEQAQQLFLQGKPAEALALLDQLSEIYPHVPHAMYARARCLVALGRLTEARSICLFLRDGMGHARGTELLAQIDAKSAPAVSSPFEAPRCPAPRYASAARAQRGGLGKILALGVSGVAAIAIVGGALYFLTGSAQSSKVADAAPLPLPDKPTYYKDVAPILNDNCVVCHRPGEAVPMSLTSFDLVRPWAKSMRNMVETRQMPPWHADPSVGEWENDRRLSDRDVDTIVRWIDQGTPQGDPEDAPKVPTFTKGWQIGEPDMTFTAFNQTLPAELEDEYRYVIVPTGFTEDRWISAAEIRPGNINVVHHVIVFAGDPAKGQNGLSGSLGGFAPGSPPLKMDKGRGMKIAKGSVLVLQIHYHKEPGTVEQDQTVVGIKFAKETVTKEVRFADVGTQDFAIPPRDAFYPVEAKRVLEQDVHIEQIVPHMHLRGIDMKVWAKFPDGRMQDLLYVPKYDFNWQTFYKLKQPISLPKGTELIAYAHYDNSANNPFNPDPNAVVRWGEPTTAEMMYAFFMYTVDDEKLKVKDPGA